ncbi:MAG: hypothetical protein NWQ38_07665 [Cellulophaga sp.]|nr:hypothetical protein [Cellulophaga sp.]
MIKRILFTAVFYLLFSTLYVRSQEASRSVDYIVLNTSDTLYGKVQHINEKRFSPEYYKKIRYTNQQGKQKKFKRKDVLAFKVDDQLFEGFWLKESSQNGLFGTFTYDIDAKKGERNFLRVLHRGTLNHYELGWWEQGESLFLSMALFKKQHDSFLIRADQGLLGLKRKSLTHYFQGCSELQIQIENKMLKNASEIINFYEANCSLN